MRWLTWLRRRVSPDPAQGVRDSFAPREWDAYFAGLTPEQRHAASARLCRKAVAAVSLTGEAVEQAATRSPDCSARTTPSTVADGGIPAEGALRAWSAVRPLQRSATGVTPVECQDRFPYVR